MTEAVHRSRQFYGLTLPPDTSTFKGLLSHLIDEGVQSGDYAPHIMGMHFNFYWHRLLLEECDHGKPCAEVALAPLRSFVYRMVLNRQEQIVVEYGRTPYEEFSSAGVRDIYNIYTEK